MDSSVWKRAAALALGVVAALGAASGAADAAVRIDGQVQAGGGAVAGSTVTLWAASAGEPEATGASENRGRRQLCAQHRRDAGTRREPLSRSPRAASPRSTRARATIRRWRFWRCSAARPRPRSPINEMTTVASVWTNAQFLDGAAIKGPALSLSIAAGNVAEFRRSRNRRVGRRPFRTRSTAARRRRWRISPRSPMRSRVARRGSRPSPAKCSSRRPSRRRATRRPIR